MSQTSKMVLVAVIAALIGGGGVYFWETDESQESPSVSVQEQELNEPETVTEFTPSNEWNELIRYNCELSGGSFSDNSCVCPIEEEIGQTQEEMYDKSTGYCQSSMGGPGGDAFAASVGLPWDKYSFWTDIVGNNCTETDGEWLNALCTCSDGKTYDESTGYCE